MPSARGPLLLGPVTGYGGLESSLKVLIHFEADTLYMGGDPTHPLSSSSRMLTEGISSSGLIYCVLLILCECFSQHVW
jgi:hypothetical protein